MTNATMLVDGVLCLGPQTEVPAGVVQIVERHRQTLLGLAHALIAAGRDEAEVIAILTTASDSFSSKLKMEIERVLS